MTSAKPKSRPRPTKADSQTELRALTHPEVRAIVLGIMLAMFLGALDQTIVATALPTIGRHFGNLEDLSWVVTAYLLTGTAVTPLYGKLADIHGRRVVMLTAIVIFVTGSVACALAPTMSALVLSRGFQGLGGGGLMALAQTIIADIVSPRERGRYQGYIGAVFATSSVGGPVLGGFLTEHIDWSLIFWINLPLGLCALGMTSNVLRRVPYQPRKHKLDVAALRAEFFGNRVKIASKVARFINHIDQVLTNHTARWIGNGQRHLLSEMIGKCRFGGHERFEIIVFANCRSYARPFGIGARPQIATSSVLVSTIVWEYVFEFGAEPLFDRTSTCLELAVDPVSPTGIVVAFGCWCLRVAS